MRTGIPCQFLNMRNLYDFTVLGPLVAVLRHSQAQVVHTNHPIDAMLGNLAAHLVSIPCITTFHSTLAQYYLPKTKFLTRYLTYLRYLWAERIAGRLANSSVAVSNCVREELIRQKVCLPDKVTTIHNGIDLDEFDISHYSKVATNRLTVGAVSRIAADKGVHHFVEAAIQVSESRPEVQFILAGEAKNNAEQKFLEKCLNRLVCAGKQSLVQFLGPRTDIPFLISQMDLIVVPSLAEGFGLVAIEAMAMGKPVIASHVGGLPEIIVDGETGILVEPGNASAIANAVQHLLQDANLRAEMGRKARLRVETHFSMEQMVDQLLQCYELIV